MLNYLIAYIIGGLIWVFITNLIAQGLRAQDDLIQFLLWPIEVIASLGMWIRR